MYNFQVFGGIFTCFEDIVWEGWIKTQVSEVCSLRDKAYKWIFYAVVQDF